MKENIQTPALPDRPSWKLRRIAIFGWLIFCVIVSFYVIIFGDPTSEIHDSALFWAFSTGAATVFSYAGFATLEDINLSKLIARKTS